MRKLSTVVFSLWLTSVAAWSQPSPVPGSSEDTSSTTANRAAPVLPDVKHRSGIHWGPLLRDWWVNLCMDQAVRVAKESKTRDALSGPFFHDWFTTVTTYHFNRWDDDDKFITSNVAHPFQGAVAAAIFWQNDDHVRFSDQDFHSAAYRHALLQAFAFATFDAVQWKLGPLSESSIGNVGLPAHWWDADCGQFNIKCEPRTGLNDLILNEFVGVPMFIGFQWLDKHVQRRIEAGTPSRALIDTTRMLTNPAATVANVVRFRRPWFRDNRR
jgi:hypothetical protein